MKERNSNALVCILCMCKGTVTLATKTCNLFCDYFAPGGGGGGEVLLVNLGGGVPPGTLNPAPISDPKMLFSTPVFRPGLKHYWLAFRPEIT